MRKFKIFGNEVVIGKRLVGVGREDDYYGMSALNYGSDFAKFAELDAYDAMVYACINRIAESYASYEPIIEKRNGDQWEDVGDHALLDLLRNPTGTEDSAAPVTMFDLLFATAAFIELQADVYWYLPTGSITGLPKEIIILRADKVGQKLDNKGEVEYYYVRNATGQNIRIEKYNMLPFLGFNPKDPYHGKSTVAAAKDYIATDEFTTRFTKNFFKNNAGLSGVLSVKGEVVKTAFKKFVNAWRDKYQGVDNAGKVMIVRDADAKFEKVGLGLNELDMDSLRKMSRDDICLMFGVPLELLGKISEGSGLGRANLEVLEYIFAKYTINPKLKRLDGILRFALERYWKTTDLRVTHANIIPEDKEAQLAYYDKAVDRWMTRNEIRRERGLDTLDGGDQLFIPMVNVPVDEASTQDSTSEDAGKSIGTGIMLKVKRKVVDNVDDSVEKTEGQEINSVHKEGFRLKLMKNQRAYERRYRKKFNPVLEEQRKEALYNLEAHAGSILEATGKSKDLIDQVVLDKALQQKLFDDAAYDAKMMDKLMPVLHSLGEQQGSLALVFAGDDSTDFRLTAAYETILRKSTEKMAKRFNDETLEALNKTLAEGIQEGEALAKLKSRVEEVYNGAEGYRSLRVARTETLKASNTATNEAYRQTGYVTGKQWYVNPGADEECEAFAGKTIPLDEDFLKQGESFTYTDSNGDEQTATNSYDDVDSPPLHPNCRCTIIPVR